MELSQAISQAIKAFGKDIITESRFVNILADYGMFKEREELKFVIRELVNLGYTDLLLRSVSTSLGYNEILSDLQFKIQKKMPFQQNVLQEVLDSMLSCYITIPTPIEPNDEALAPSQANDTIESHNSTLGNTSSNKNLSLSNFSPLYGIELGRTTYNEALNLENVNTADDCFRINGVFFEFEDEDPEKVFDSYFVSKIGLYNYSFPQKLTDNGCSMEMSYNQWIIYLRSKCFNIKIRKSPYYSESQYSRYFKAKISGISSDNSMQIILDFLKSFNKKKDSNVDVDTIGTLDSISIIALK